MYLFEIRRCVGLFKKIGDKAMGKKIRFKNNNEIKNYNAILLESFRNEHKERVVEVPLKDIYLTESIHKNAIGKFTKVARHYKKVGKEVNQSLLVRKTTNGYALLAGWKHYKLAKELGQEKVNVIVVDFKSRRRLMKAIGCYNEFKVCKLTELKIPAKFDVTVVNPQKLEAIKEYDYKYHAPMKPITVDKDMLIVDGYAQYVYNRNMGKEYCEIKIVS